MVYKTRIFHSEEIKDFIWDRYSEGESITSISRSSSSVYNIFSPTGSIRQSERKRSPCALSK